MNNLQRKYTFYLFARPTFLTEMGRFFDFFGILNKYNYSKDEAEADKKALYLDWCSVGQDLQSAMGKYEQSQ